MTTICMAKRFDILLHESIIVSKIIKKGLQEKSWIFVVMYMTEKKWRKEICIIINRYVEDINIWAAMTMCTRQETYGSCINLRRQFSFNFPHINFVKTLNEPLYTHVSAIIT